MRKYLYGCLIVLGAAVNAMATPCNGDSCPNRPRSDVRPAVEQPVATTSTPIVVRSEARTVQPRRFLRGRRCR